jgi:hypothetical protein
MHTCLQGYHHLLPLLLLLLPLLLLLLPLPLLLLLLLLLLWGIDLMLQAARIRLPEAQRHDFDEFVRLLQGVASFDFQDLQQR